MIKRTKQVQSEYVSDKACIMQPMFQKAQILHVKKAKQVEPLLRNGFENDCRTMSDQTPESNFVSGPRVMVIHIDPPLPGMVTRHFNQILPGSTIIL